MKKYDQYVNDQASLYTKWFSYIGMGAIVPFREILPQIKDVDMRTRGKEKKTGLYYAIEKMPTGGMLTNSGQVQAAMWTIINELIDNGADPNAFCVDLWAGERVVTPVWRAATKHLPDVLKLLITKGGDVNVGNNSLDFLTSQALIITNPKDLFNGTIIYHAIETIDLIKILILNKIKVTNEFFMRFKKSIDVYYDDTNRMYRSGVEDHVKRYKEALEEFVDWLSQNDVNVPMNIKKISINKKATRFDL